MAGIREKVWQVVLRTDKQKGFRILPWHWVAERTFAWILNGRRLNKEYGKSRPNSQFMGYPAMIPLMINRLK